MGLKASYSYTVLSEVTVDVTVRAASPEEARGLAYEKAGKRFNTISRRCNAEHGDLSIWIPDPKDPEGVD